MGKKIAKIVSIILLLLAANPEGWPFLVHIKEAANRNLALAEEQKTNIVRVAIVRDAKNITLDIKAAYRIYTLYTDELMSQAQKLSPCKVSPLLSGIKVGSQDFKVFAIKIIPDKDATIYINKRIFRGQVDIIREQDLTLTVVNHIEVDDYVKGVLYNEISNKWPLEAIKAQAVVSRTFALYNAKINAHKDYDLTNDIYSQVYGGKTSEKYKTSFAVDKTKGEILTYNGEILPAYFHSTCAGHTEDVSVLWNQDLAPLKGVECKYCRKSKHYKWSKCFSLHQIRDTLLKNDYQIDDIQDIIVTDRNKSGRVTQLKILGKDKELLISAKDFRQIFNPQVIRSTNFNVQISDANACFNGLGWGHGVGMCQWGAYFMAYKDYKYDAILSYYYPGAKISRLGKN